MKDRPAILVVGSLNMDLTLQLPRMPLVGESLVGLRYSRTPGGKGANQAVALARMGADVTLVGKVGDDADGEKLIANLAANGVTTDFVGKAGGNSTGLAVILLDSDGRNSIAVFPAANDEMAVADLAAAFAQNRFDALVLQLEIPDPVIIESYRLARGAAVPVFLDAGPARPFPLEELWGIDVISPNETEVRALTGIEVKTLAEAELAATELIRRTNTRAVVIKLGSSGALLRTREGYCRHFPAFAVRAVDPTAAGDAFTAALAIQLLKTEDIPKSVIYANLAGALATTRLGAQTSLPTAQEIELFREQLRLKPEVHV